MSLKVGLHGISTMNTSRKCVCPVSTADCICISGFWGLCFWTPLGDFRPPDLCAHFIPSIAGYTTAWRQPKKINFLTLVSYLLLQTDLARKYRFATIQNVRQSDRQADNTVSANKNTSRAVTSLTSGRHFVRKVDFTALNRLTRLQRQTTDSIDQLNFR